MEEGLAAALGKLTDEEYRVVSEALRVLLRGTWESAQVLQGRC